MMMVVLFAGKMDVMFSVVISQITLHMGVVLFTGFMVLFSVVIS